MDRYIVREPRVGAECPEGNQIIAFSTSTAGNNMIPEMYYGPYGSEYQNVRVENRYGVPQSYAQANMMHVQQAQMMSGIDPAYLAAYSNSSVSYIAGHQQMQREMQMERQCNAMQFRSDPPFGSDYQNRNLMPVDRSKTFNTQVVETPHHFDTPIPKSDFDSKIKPQNMKQTLQLRKDTASVEIPHHFYTPIPKSNFDSIIKPQNMKQTLQLPKDTKSAAPPKKPNKMELQKIELQNQVLTRSDKLKALQKSGPRAFSGPVEKVLKWHKTLQEIGILIIFEIVAKCVSIRQGDACSKILVVRDENGPAMQVVYYEIDFLLPELKPPCTVRVIGRMMPGTCRLQAFNVRPATGDDVATLPRRAAVASHHIAKLCKEFETSMDKN